MQSDNNKKGFEGQYVDEQLLFKKHESKASIALKITPKIIGILIIGVLISWLVLYVWENILIFVLTIIFFVIILVIYLYFVKKFYGETFFAFTNKRAVKSVRAGLFSSHLKELKIQHIRQTTANNDGILPKMFKYGNINVQGPESENSLYFRDISENKAIVLYISRIMDLIREKGEDTELWEFKSKF